VGRCVFGWKVSEFATFVSFHTGFFQRRTTMQMAPEWKKKQRGEVLAENPLTKGLNDNLRVHTMVKAKMSTSQDMKID